MAGAAVLLVVPARAAEPNVVAVWALAGGDTPLAGARVEILEGRRVLLQSTGRRDERASRGGVSLLAFRRVPRTFTVEVSPRERLGGTFWAVVRGYQPGTVVFVNPVSTLIAEVLASQHPHGRSVTAARAQREVYRVLGIPSWETQDELRYSDNVFDGRNYLRAARRSGGVSTLDRELVGAAIVGGRRHRFAGPQVSHGPIARSASATSELVSRVFKELALGVVSGIGSKTATTVLGWMMSAFGFGEAESQDLKDVKATLDELGKQLTQLSGHVNQAAFSTLVGQTRDTIGQINHALSDLAAIAQSPEPEKRKSFSQDAVDYVRSHLLDAPEILNEHLNSKAPLADNLLKAASRAVSSGVRFFDAGSSDLVRSVYDYFASYQATVAMVLTEYYHAKATDPGAIKFKLDQIEGNIAEQAKWLKPRVPERTVLDTRTGLMWTQTLFNSYVVRLGDLIELEPQFPKYEVRLKPFATSTALPGLPFSNWSLPTFDDMNALLSHRGDNSPYDWLANQAHMNPFLLKATQSHFWLRETFHTRLTSFGYGVARDELCYELYSLNIASTAALTCKFVDTSAERQSVLGIEQGALYLRRPASGEEYWWR